MIVVGIGASAGGLEAQEELLRHLPVSANACYLIAQHISPSHKSMMVDLLSKYTEIPVTEARHGDSLSVNTIYVTPPNKNISVKNNKILLTEPAEHTILPKPSIDFLLTSLAMEFGSCAIGIILSGTGRDGSMGMKAIKAEGGMTLVQEPRTAKYNSMPLASINDHHADIILSPSDMGDELASVFDYMLGKSPIPPRQTPKSDLMILFTVLKQKHGVDFSEYKQTTINRRIQRRMFALHIQETSNYVKYIQENHDELTLLFKDLLIGVTSFFRDADEFEALKSALVPLLEEKADKQEAFRVWVAACSSGEEAYSLAILLHELGIENVKDISIFATDIDSDAIHIARSGIYPETSIETIPPALVEKYFDRDEDRYRIKKPIREMIIFSIHDVTNDPPFARMDLIMCRNLLIYFGNELQERVLNTFAFSLKNNGLLFLGHSESTLQLESAFLPLQKERHLFRKIFSADKKRVIPGPGARRSRNESQKVSDAGSTGVSTETLLQGYLLNSISHEFLPLSVLINETMTVLFIREENPYLKLPAKMTTLNILKMIPQEMELDLRTAIHDVQKRNTTQVTRFRKITLPDNSVKMVRLVVIPVTETYQRLNLFVVSFQQEEVNAFISSESGEQKNISDDSISKYLEIELKETRAHLQAVVEELETSNEELQAANEELQSTNEELQSSNEELETTNEELHSTNEEIQVAYNELKVTSEEKEKLREIAEDALDKLTREQKLLKGISDSSLYAIIALEAKRDDQFDIAGFNCIHINQQAESVFGIESTTVVGQDIQKALPIVSEPSSFRDFIRVANTRESDVAEIEINLNGQNSCFNRVIVPYIDGVVISYFDITERIREQEKFQIFQKRYQLASESSHFGIWEWNLNDKRLFWDKEMFALFQVDANQEMSIEAWQKLLEPETNKQALSQVIDEIIHGQQNIEIEYQAGKDNERKFFRLKASLFTNRYGRPDRVIGTCIDISDFINTQQMLEATSLRAKELSEKKSRFVANVSHELRTPLHAIVSFAHLAKKKSSVEAMATMLDKVEINASRLRYLVDELLDISKISSRDLKKTIERRNIFQTVEHAIDINSALFDESNQHIEKKLSYKGEADFDEKLMIQVLTNLLSNAHKYSMPGSTICISLSEATINDQVMIKIQISDSGMGIPSEHLESIFDPFEQASNAMKNEMGGTGLGLSISRTIIELHHGTIKATSPLPDGKPGSLFTILFPKYRGEAG